MGIVQSIESIDTLEDEPLAFPLYELIVLTILYCIMGSLNFKLLPKPGPRRLMSDYDYYYYYGNHISLVHTVVALLLAFYKYTVIGTEFCEKAHVINRTMALQTLAYFIQDSIYEEVYHYADNVIRMHHVLGLTILPYSFYCNYGLPEMITGMTLAELSNPLMAVRTILKKRGDTYFDSFPILEGIFVFLWILGRVILGYPFTWINFSCTEGSSFMYLMIGSFTVISTWWTFKILLILLRKFQAYCESKQMNPLWYRCYKTYIEFTRDSLIGRIQYHGLAFAILLIPLFLRFYRQN